MIADIKRKRRQSLGTDFYLIDEFLTEEERRIRDKVRTFCDREVIPDFNIGPGYTYEERNSFFTMGFSTSLPVFNRNQGPIAETEARRKEAAVAFLQTQAQVIEKSERALAVYKAALKEVAEAKSLYQLQEAQVQRVQENIRAGADYRLSLDGAQIQASILARVRLDALARAQWALGDLENAVQRPLAPGEMPPISPESPSLREWSEARNP